LVNTHYSPQGWQWPAESLCHASCWVSAGTNPWSSLVTISVRHFCLQYQMSARACTNHTDAALASTSTKALSCRSMTHTTVELVPSPLRPPAFAPYGDVIEANTTTRGGMNQDAFERFGPLASITVAPNDSAGPGSARGLPNSQAGIALVRSATATPLPHRFSLIERHPLCSQAFIPRADFSFLVVVGPREKSAAEIAATDLKAFICAPGQGINYFAGTWHMPLISTAVGQEFLVVDQADRPGNLEELVLPQSVTLLAAA